MKYAALFVGVDHYQNGIQTLQCAENDAKLLFSFFSKYWDKIDFLQGKDANSNNVEKRIKELCAGLDEEDFFLFYFAGHGQQLGEKHYLIGPDAEFDKNEHSWVHSLTVSRVISLTEKPGVRRLFLLDTCRSHLMPTRGAAYQATDAKARDAAFASLLENTPQEASVIPPTSISSCSQGEVAYELPPQGGVFTLALLDLLKNCNGYMDLSTLEDNLPRKVQSLLSERLINQPHGEQNPSFVKTCMNFAILNERPFSPTDTAPLAVIVPEVLDVDDILPQAQALIAQKKYDQAIKLLKKSDTEDADVQGLLGKCYYKKQANYTAALKWYRKAAEQGNAEGQCGLGELYFYGYVVRQNYEEAVKRYRQAAEQGNDFGQYSLGYMYEMGKGIEKNFRKAAEWYQKAIDQGNVKAKEALARVNQELQKAAEEERQKEEARRRKAAEQGNATAKNNLAFMYKNGRGGSQDYTKTAKKSYKVNVSGTAAPAKIAEKPAPKSKSDTVTKAANQESGSQMTAKQRVILLVIVAVTVIFSMRMCENTARAKTHRKPPASLPVYSPPPETPPDSETANLPTNANAQCELGNKYYNEGKYEEAVKWFRKAAEQGDITAQYNLGVMYERCKGIPQDGAEAVKWYSKAAEQGDVHAQYNLGMMYDNARGIPQDYAEAVKWYRKAAEQGDVHAQYNLGMMYKNGRGVSQDHTEAVTWFRKAAEQGDVDAQYNLGMMYDNNQGVSQDYAEAVKWFRKAAEQGNANAQNYLGWMYEKGHGVTPSDVEAVRWYRKAAEQGNDRAQYNLGVMYGAGRGVTPSNVEAVKWYRKAAEQGNAAAQNNLGWMYKNGRGVRQSNTEAVKWYRKAAEQGNAVAQYNLGVMYQDGRGVLQSAMDAVKWFRKAAEQGHKKAQAQLKKMMKDER